MKNRPIYPKIAKTVFSEGMMYETYLRKQHTDGKWYFWYFMKKFQADAVGSFPIDHLEHFYAHIYNIMILGTVEPEVTFNYTETPVFELDDDQQTEYDRLAAFIPKHSDSLN